MISHLTIEKLNNVDQFQAYVEDLASDNSVAYKKTASEILAKSFTRLSDDNPSTDKTRQLLIALKQANVISGKEMLSLLRKYFYVKQHI